MHVYLNVTGCHPSIRTCVSEVSKKTYKYVCMYVATYTVCTANIPTCD